MQTFVWLTDPHLNFCRERAPFLGSVARLRPEAVLLGGDIAEAPTLERELVALADAVGVPVFLVLGNHDYYHGSVAGVRRSVEALCGRDSRLHWLPALDFAPLTGRTALVGHGGWADGRFGDYAGSGVRLNDHRLIEDFIGKDSRERLEVMQRLGDEAAAHLARVLPLALGDHERVIVLTHVPPFREATWHEGRTSDRFYLPHFSCKAVGDVLLEAAGASPARELIILCGHTHSPGRFHPLPNLHVFTGGAVYGSPTVQGRRLLDADGDVESFAATIATR